MQLKIGIRFTEIYTAPLKDALSLPFLQIAPL